MVTTARQCRGAAAGRSGGMEEVYLLAAQRNRDAYLLGDR